MATPIRSHLVGREAAPAKGNLAVVQLFQEMIERYDRVDYAPRCPELFDRFRIKADGILKRYASGLALDLGGYDGRVSDGCANCILADIAITPLKYAHEKNRVCVRCDMHQLPFAAASFGLIFIGHALQHSPEPMKVVAEAKRVLRQDGRLILVVPNAASLAQLTRLVFRGEVKPAGNPPNGAALQIHQYTIANIRDLLSTAGLEIESVSGDAVTFPLVHRLRAYGAASWLGSRLPALADSLVVICAPTKAVLRRDNS